MYTGVGVHTYTGEHKSRCTQEYTGVHRSKCTQEEVYTRTQENTRAGVHASVDTIGCHDR